MQQSQTIVSKLINVALPNILVVRQVVHDKFGVNKDGSVSLKRVYYHQEAKLNLVRKAG